MSRGQHLIEYSSPFSGPYILFFFSSVMLPEPCLGRVGIDMSVLLMAKHLVELLILGTLTSYVCLC